MTEKSAKSMQHLGESLRIEMVSGRFVTGKVGHREGSPEEGSQQNWKVCHSFGRFATNIIERFATMLECITKQVTVICLLYKYDK